jgi:uncharacterized protein involved in exopolysaccharide biosynthesis
MFTVDGADTSPKPAGPAPEPASGGLPVAPQRVALALKQRWRVLVACTAAAAALGAVAAKTIVPREFTATTVLSWEPAVGTQDAARELRSLVDAVELPDNLALVRERTALPLTLEAVGSSVTVATSAASNVISIVGTADAPEDAARIAEATAEVFLADRVRVARAQLGEKLSHLDDDAKAARNSVDLAHSAYDVFRTEEGLADPAAETLAAIEHTSRLRTEADLSRAALDSESARARSLAGAADTRPERTVLAQKEVRPVAEKLAVERTELAARRARLSEDHPQVAALAAEVESLERRGTTKDAAIAERTVGQDPTRAALDQELARTRAEVEASRTRGTAYASLLATAEARLERLSGLSHRAAALTADIRSAESHLAEVETERARTRDAFRAPPTGFRVIAHAIVPSLPSSSLRRPVAALSPLLGLLIGLVLALVRSPPAVSRRDGDGAVFLGPRAGPRLFVLARGGPRARAAGARPLRVAACRRAAARARARRRRDGPRGASRCRAARCLSARRVRLVRGHPGLGARGGHPATARASGGPCARGRAGGGACGALSLVARRAPRPQRRPRLRTHGRRPGACDALGSCGRSGSFSRRDAGPQRPVNQNP